MFTLQEKTRLKMAMHVFAKLELWNQESSGDHDVDDICDRFATAISLGDQGSIKGIVDELIEYDE